MRLGDCKPGTIVSKDMKAWLDARHRETSKLMIPMDMSMAAAT